MLTKKTLRKTVEKFAVKEFARQVDFIRYFLDAHDFNPYMVINWKDDLTSYGGTDYDGKPHIEVALKVTERFLNEDTALYDEYAFIEKDMGIGEEMVGWRVYVAFLIAHELAHAVEFERYAGNKAAKLFRVRRRPEVREGHGKLWQTIYRVLRDSVRRQGLGISRKGA